LSNKTCCGWGVVNVEVRDYCHLMVTERAGERLTLTRYKVELRVFLDIENIVHALMIKFDILYYTYNGYFSLVVDQVNF
jgi:hypothetical protein